MKRTQRYQMAERRVPSLFFIHIFRNYFFHSRKFFPFSKLFVSCPKNKIQWQLSLRSRKETFYPKKKLHQWIKHFPKNFSHLETKKLRNLNISINTWSKKRASWHFHLRPKKTNNKINFLSSCAINESF